MTPYGVMNLDLTDEEAAAIGSSANRRVAQRLQLTAAGFRLPPCRYHGFRKPNRRGALTNRER
jgi:hypothetical protein